MKDLQGFLLNVVSIRDIAVALKWLISLAGGNILDTYLSSTYQYQEMYYVCHSAGRLEHAEVLGGMFRHTLI
jgi:hypothetical protein